MTTLSNLKKLSNCVPLFETVKRERLVKGIYFVSVPAENSPINESTRYHCFVNADGEYWEKHDPFRDEVGSYEVNLNRVKKRVRGELFNLVELSDREKVDEMVEELFGGLR